jgi:hypothetical protein
MIANTSDPMNNEKLELVLRRVATVLDGTPGYWRVELEGRELLAISDEQHNRMRIISPIIEIDKLDGDTAITVLAANFDRALDAKYAISQDILWSVFMHRLKELTEDQIEDGIHQVVALAQNFGSSYSSSNLIFGGE